MSTPINNFNTPSYPNAINNPYFLEVPTKYFNKRGWSGVQLGEKSKIKIDQIG